MAFECLGIHGFQRMNPNHSDISPCVTAGWQLSFRMKCLGGWALDGKPCSLNFGDLSAFYQARSVNENDYFSNALVYDQIPSKSVALTSASIQLCALSSLRIVSALMCQTNDSNSVKHSRKCWCSLICSLIMWERIYCVWELHYYWVTRIIFV